jgi:D-alanyl-lipoteichoic acid acyltransferase DltB (MBOAT superfamily)
MLFPTIDFAIFFVVVFTGNWLLRPHPRRWRWFMLIASLVFYGWFRWYYVFLLLGSIIVNWFFGERIYAALGSDGERTEASRRLVRLAVVVNLGTLGVFKYAEFALSTGSSWLNRLGFDLDPPLIGILLPVGISFFTFQAISYVVDIGRGEWRRPMPLLDFAVYLSFFAHLVAGPIVRASEFAPQLDHRPDPRAVESSEAFMHIFRGLFKKVVVSSYMATVADPVFQFPGGHSSLEVLFGIYAYAIQIYADFSGYTDIAFGVALLLGIRFPQNFDAPYRSLSVQEFWRRWHMTLSRWLRDYLYIPLGGNRSSRLVTLVNPELGAQPRKGFIYLNLMLTMLLGGLWHGANWTFVVWGAIHGTALIVERVIRARWAQRQPLGLPARVVPMLQWALTFHVVALAWVFFRASSLDVALDVLGRLLSFAGGPSDLVTPLLVVTIGAMLASQFVPPQVPKRVERGFGRVAPALQAGLVAVALVGINALGPEGIAPFIYFQF